VSLLAEGMALQDPIWPSLRALDNLWQNPEGAEQEATKAKALQSLAQGQVPARPRTLIIGAASPAVLAALTTLNPSALIQAYPPPLGMRAGAHPALMMDTDLPPFSRGHFDLVVISHVLEYRSTPLALISLAYEILQPHGRLAVFTPHALGARDLMPGYGARYWGWGVTALLRQSAYSPRGGRLVMAGRWRPATNLHLAQPQVPPQPTNRLRIYTPLMEFWRSRQRGGIAATDLSRHGRGYEKT